MDLVGGVRRGVYALGENVGGKHDVADKLRRS